MADKKPERLEKLEKGRKFAPIKRAKKAKGNAESVASASGGAGASAPGDDPFQALLEQAKLAKAQNRKSMGSKQKGQFQVAFGGEQTFDQSMDGRHNVIIGPGTRGSGGGGGGGSGGGGAGGGSGGGSSGAKVKGPSTSGKGALEELDDKKVDKMDLDIPEEFETHEPFLDRRRYYPTMLPFKDPDERHDPDALAHTAVPKDLAEGPEQFEGNTTAAKLELLDVPGDVVTLVQLPNILPSSALMQAAEQAVPKDAQTGTDVVEPFAYLSGPDILRNLPGGKIGSVKVYKSGKVAMKIGCTDLVVTPGVETKCCSEMFLVNLRRGHIVMVGTGTRQAVAAVDISNLLAEQKLESATTGT